MLQFITFNRKPIRLFLVGKQADFLSFREKIGNQLRFFENSFTRFCLWRGNIIMARLVRKFVVNQCVVYADEILLKIVVLQAQAKNTYTEARSQHCRY